MSPPENGRTGRRKRIRFHAVRADDIRPGDLLWSDATMRELAVVAVYRADVSSSGNLLGEQELGDPDAEAEQGPPVQAIAFAVVDRRTGEQQRLGGFAPHARVQVVR